MINTATELEALPVGAGIVDKHGDLGLIDRIEGQRVVHYAETTPLTIEYVAKHYLPATVVHDPSAPAPAVSDAAVEAASQALFVIGTGFNADEWANVTETFRGTYAQWARAALTAALPFLGAAPSATREDVEDTLVMTRLSDYAGSDMAVIGQTAEALLARFTITPKTDR